MKRTTIVLRDWNAEPILTLDGYLFDCHGIPMVVHQGTSTSVNGGIITLLDMYQVSEPISGGRVTLCTRKRQDAINKAHRAVFTVGVEKTLRLIEKKKPKVG